jgi:hypothetical protein
MRASLEPPSVWVSDGVRSDREKVLAARVGSEVVLHEALGAGVAALAVQLTVKLAQREEADRETVAELAA